MPRTPPSAPAQRTGGWRVPISLLLACLLLRPAAGAALEFSVPIPLNSDSAVDSGWDAAPHLASDGRGVLVAVWESERSLGDTIGGDLDILFARSADDGRTWSRPAALNRTAATDAAMDSVPQVATDGSGTWVAVWESMHVIGGTITAGPDVFAARSTDGGQTWSDAVALNHDAGETFTARTPVLAVDEQGTWVAAWVASGFPPGTSELRTDVVVARSHDGGATWSAPVPISGAGGADTGRELDPHLVTDRHGVWVAVWSAQDQAGRWDIHAARSVDGAATWESPRPVAPGGGGDDLRPSAATDGSGVWLVAWESTDPLDATIGADRDILVARSMDGGRTWTAPSPANQRAPIDSTADRGPALAVEPDGTWIVAWIDASTSDPHAAHARSTDAGATWSAPGTLGPTGTPADSDEEITLSCGTHGTCLAVWQAVNWRGGALGTDRDVLFARSVDAGATWTARAPLNRTALSDDDWNVNPTVAGAPDGTWIALWNTSTPWADESGGDWDIAVARSTDNGATWTASSWLSATALSDAVIDRGSDWTPRLATDGLGTWVAVWSCQLWNGAFWDRDVCSARSTDRGASWSPPARISTVAASPAEAEVDEFPDLATNGAGTWVAVWQTWRAGARTAGTDTDLLTARSTDGGRTWSAPTWLNVNAGTDSGDDRRPTIAGDSTGAWIAAWQSTDTLANTIGTDADVLVARSTDDGATWSEPGALDPAADRNTGNDDFVRLATDGAGTWLAVWHSSDSAISGGPDTDVAFARSTDGGATWTPPAPIDAAAAGNSAIDWSPVVASNAQGEWTVVWESRGLSGTPGGADIAVAQSFDDGDSWTPPAPLRGPARRPGTHWRPALASNGREGWVAVWEGMDLLDPRIGRDFDVLVSRGAAAGVFPTATTTATPTRTATRPATPRRTVTPSAAPTAIGPRRCGGDCNGDGTVTIGEIIAAVNILLGTTAPSACPAADANGDGTVGVNELIGGVNNALCGCAPCPTPPPATPTPTSTRTPTRIPVTPTPTVDVPSERIEAACDQNCRLARSCDPEEFDEFEGSIGRCTEFCVGDFDGEPLSCIEATLGYFDCVNGIRRCGLPSACSGAFAAASNACPGGFPGPPSVFY